jgi:hypothetical protein
MISKLAPRGKAARPSLTDSVPGATPARRCVEGLSDALQPLERDRLAAQARQGYLYAHGQLPVSDRNAKAEAAHADRTAKPRPEPQRQTRTPKIEYRKRRSYGSLRVALAKL